VGRILRESHPLAQSLSFSDRLVMLMLGPLDVQLLSVDKVSDAHTTVSSPQVKDGSTV